MDTLPPGHYCMEIYHDEDNPDAISHVGGVFGPFDDPAAAARWQDEAFVPDDDTFEDMFVAAHADIGAHLRSYPGSADAATVNIYRPTPQGVIADDDADGTRYALPPVVGISAPAHARGLDRSR